MNTRHIVLIEVARSLREQTDREPTAAEIWSTATGRPALRVADGIDLTEAAEARRRRPVDWRAVGRKEPAMSHRPRPTTLLPAFGFIDRLARLRTAACPDELSLDELDALVRYDAAHRAEREKMSKAELEFEFSEEYWRAQLGW